MSSEWLLVQFSTLLCSVPLCRLNLGGKYSLLPQASVSEHPKGLVTIPDLSITRFLDYISPGLSGEVPILGRLQPCVQISIKESQSRTEVITHGTMPDKTVLLSLSVTYIFSPITLIIGPYLDPFLPEHLVQQNIHRHVIKQNTWISKMKWL